MGSDPLITVAVPSYNQACYLETALASVVNQAIPVEVFVLDGGSSDHSVDIIKRWEHKLAGWRSYSDEGQAAAINEGIALGTAPFVCWLNSDDWLLPNGLAQLLHTLESYPNAPAVYGQAWNFIQETQQQEPVWVEPFNEHRLAFRCIISQPATLIRRSAWEKVGGLNEDLDMVMDYDLWWRLFKSYGPLVFLEEFVAVNREHSKTKTSLNQRVHYQEAILIVRRHYGKVPLKWWLKKLYITWFKHITKRS